MGWGWQPAHHRTGAAAAFFVPQLLASSSSRPLIVWGVAVVQRAIALRLYSASPTRCNPRGCCRFRRKRWGRTLLPAHHWWPTGQILRHPRQRAEPQVNPPDPPAPCSHPPGCQIHQKPYYYSDCSTTLNKQQAGGLHSAQRLPRMAVHGGPRWQAARPRSSSPGHGRGAAAATATTSNRSEAAASKGSPGRQCQAAAGARVPLCGLDMNWV